MFITKQKDIHGEINQKYILFKIIQLQISLLMDTVAVIKHNSVLLSLCYNTKKYYLNNSSKAMLSKVEILQSGKVFDQMRLYDCRLNGKNSSYSEKCL